MVLVKNRQVVSDGWKHLEDADAIPDVGAVTISWARWAAERDAIKHAAKDLGVRLPNTVPIMGVGVKARVLKQGKKLVELDLRDCPKVGADAVKWARERGVRVNVQSQEKGKRVRDGA